MIMLLTQVILISTFSYFIIYRAIGKNYEVAVFAYDICGFCIGATPNTIANIDELTNIY